MNHLDFACLPALLAVMASSWAEADEPFGLPAPPLRSRPVYLAPDPLPAPKLPGGLQRGQVLPSSSAEPSQEGNIAPVPRGGLVPPARKSVVPDPSETDRRVERLQRQLEELNDLLARPPVDPPVIERPIASPLFEPEPQAAEKSLPSPEPVAPAQVPVEQPGPEPVHEESPKPSPAELPKSTATGLIKGLPVSAMDRVYVADNLFAAGEYVLADEIYAQVDRRAISMDESGWVEFQLANCSRRLGRLDEAKKRYRRIVADPTLGWLQDMAKWRLDAIDERELLIREHARLDAAIRQHMEAPHADVQK